MFDIHSITLTNFRSYKGTHKFEFPTVNGLYYLTGKNLLEPALGANGAGKSTFLDAITWVLYGRTTRGLKATDILTWHGKSGAQVSIDLTVGDERFKIKRSQKPNNLTVNDKPVDQKELETFIRLNYAAFTHTVINPQFGKSFFSLSASDKLTLFSEFMKLDFWLIKSDEAMKLSRQQETAVLRLRNTITRSEAQLEVLNEDVVRLRAEAANYENKRDAELAELENQFVESTKQARKLFKSISAVETNLKNSECELVVLDTQMTNSVLIRDEILDEMSVMTSKRKEILKEKNEIEAIIERLHNLRQGTCPHCEQPLKTDNINQALAQRRNSYALLNDQIKIIDAALQSSTRSLIKVKSQLAEREQRCLEMTDEIERLQKSIAKKTKKAEDSQNLLGTLKQRMQRLEQDTNPYLPTLVDKRKSVSSTREALESDGKLLANLEADLEASLYWAKGFRRIRLFIIEEAFQTLGIEINNCLAQLGMTDWQVSFDIERENKSGGITKGFVVMIKGPSNKEPVKWENWSGGETQRLQLAGDLGLSNLIMQQAGLRSEIEFYDEPSTHLSPEGMMDLADTLHDRAINEGKRIWIADHAAIASFGDFQGIIIARKDENGSSITSE